MGDFSANFIRPDSGIHTIEGNVAGSRAAALTKKRQRDQEEYENRKKQIQSEMERKTRLINDKFAHHSSASYAEKQFREKTVGLVTVDEFRKAAAEAEIQKKKKKKGGDVFLDNDQGKEEKEELTEEEKTRRAKLEKKAKKLARKKKKQMMSTLSFVDAEDAEGIVDDLIVNDDDDDDYSDDKKGKRNEQDQEEEEEQTSSSTSLPLKNETKKDPTVDTSFLPDKQREEAALAQRERLRKEWLAKQEEIKKELLEITYSYWDGSGHRRSVQCRKGDTIGQFLELVRRDLAKEFREMANVTSDALLYIKEDLIIPQDITFYDLIVTRARGKSGPLFNFDVHDDVRVGVIDVRVEKDESHPGKVVERRWYDRNKHIFPASRWEVFDPTKDYGRYTIHGGEVNKKTKK